MLDLVTRYQAAGRRAGASTPAGKKTGKTAAAKNASSRFSNTSLQPDAQRPAAPTGVGPAPRVGRGAQTAIPRSNQPVISPHAKATGPVGPMLRPPSPPAPFRQSFLARGLFGVGMVMVPVAGYILGAPILHHAGQFMTTPQELPKGCTLAPSAAGLHDQVSLFDQIVELESNPGQPVTSPQAFPPAGAAHASSPAGKIVAWYPSNHTADPSARAVLSCGDADVQRVEGYFGLNLPPQQIYVAPFWPGGYHFTSDMSKIVAGTGPQPAYAEGFAVAEIVETAEAAQGQGWNAGLTNGESLSRAIASDMYPQLGPGTVYAQGQQWWNSGHPDVVNDNHRTDQDEVANGGGSLFLVEYMHHHLGFNYQQIAQAGGKNLGETYQKLTGNSGAQGFTDFVQFCSQHVDANGQLQFGR